MPDQSPLRLGRRTFGPGEPVVMAIVNRTPDSFYDRGRTYALDAALARVDQVVDEGAAIVDIGGVKAAPGEQVPPQEEARRVIEVVERVRARHPDVVISVDTYRAAVGELVCQAGADLLNDSWGGWEPELAEVAARHDVGLVCTHTGGVPPRTRPHRVQYDDVVADVVGAVVALAERAVALGVRRDAVLIDPAHDFGKNSRHSLEVTRRLDELVATPNRSRPRPGSRSSSSQAPIASASGSGPFPGPRRATPKGRQSQLPSTGPVAAAAPTTTTCPAPASSSATADLTAARRPASAGALPPAISGTSSGGEGTTTASTRLTPGPGDRRRGRGLRVRRRRYAPPAAWRRRRAPGRPARRGRR